mmetsp:Transcript_41335/g.102874  ORF Transcript_41335/g.102874 Transcript_41335/m.102874 type:complete len:210 (+) Transcript_41335:738-1367(+)
MDYGWCRCWVVAQNKTYAPPTEPHTIHHLNIHHHLSTYKVEYGHTREQQTVCSTHEPRDAVPHTRAKSDSPSGIAPNVACAPPSMCIHLLRPHPHPHPHPPHLHHLRHLSRRRLLPEHRMSYLTASPARLVVSPPRGEVRVAQRAQRIPLEAALAGLQRWHPSHPRGRRVVWALWQGALEIGLQLGGVSVVHPQSLLRRSLLAARRQLA